MVEVSESLELLDGYHLLLFVISVCEEPNCFVVLGPHDIQHSALLRVLQLDVLVVLSDRNLFFLLVLFTHAAHLFNATLDLKLGLSLVHELCDEPDLSRDLSDDSLLKQLFMLMIILVLWTSFQSLVRILHRQPELSN